MNAVEDSAWRSFLTLGGDSKRAIVENSAVLAVGLQDAVASGTGSRGVDAEDAERSRFHW